MWGFYEGCPEQLVRLLRHAGPGLLSEGFELVGHIVGEADLAAGH
jgi:hypothetical protein